MKRWTTGIFAGLVVGLSALSAQAQVRVSINQSFESPTYAEALANGWVSNDFSNPTRTVWNSPASRVPGWNSTHSPQCFGEPCIEMWEQGSGQPAQDGNQFIELNANEPSAALLEDICLINGETLGWSFWHRNRTGGADQARFQIGNGLQVLANQTTSSTTVWSQNTNTAVVTVPTGLYDLQFVAIVPGGNSSSGNFLDNIEIDLPPLIEFDLANFADYEGGTNVPQLRISGTVGAGGITIPITVTGGTAATGDYSLPSSIFIPAGVYPNSLIDIALTLNQDTDLEGDETINIQIGAGTGYQIAPTDCTPGSGQSTATYTILDDDARLTLQKSVVFAGGGSATDDGLFTLAFDGGASGSGSGFEGDAAVSNAIITGGTFDLSESGGPAPYSMTDLSCTGAADTTTSVSNKIISIVPGETVLCTFTNTYAADPSMDVVKTLSTGPTIALGQQVALMDAGDQITYNVSVSNVGTRALNNITLVDSLPGAVIVCPSSGDNTIAILNNGDTVICSATYTLLQSDFDTNGNGDGDIDNVVTASVTELGVTYYESGAAAVPITIVEELEIVKTADTAGPVGAGNSITYTFAVANIGNTTISAISVADITNGTATSPTPNYEVLATPGGTAVSATTSDAAQNAVWDSLGPGDVIEFEGYYTVSQQDVDTLQ